MNNPTKTIEVTDYPNGGVKVLYRWPSTREECDCDCKCCECDTFVSAGTLEAVYGSQKEAAKDVQDFLLATGDWAE